MIPTCRDELIYDDLCVVAEVTKLGLPYGEGAPRTLEGVTVLEPEGGGLVQGGVEDFHLLLLALGGDGVQQGQPALTDS